MTEWAVAKRVPDLARNEPTNVGVMLWHQGEVFHRFETTPRTLAAPDLAVHEQWVTYWRDCADDRRDLERFAARRPGDGYYLELAGQLLSTAEPVDPLDLLERLFTDLVRSTPDEPPSRRFQRRVDQLIARSGLPEHPAFRRAYEITLDNQQRRRFDYAFVNGHTTVGYRLSSLRESSLDAAFHRIDHTPGEFGCVLFVPDETPADAMSAFERDVTVAMVGEVSPTDVREMFERVP